MATQDKNGGRTVHLFLPFDFNGRKIESISFTALRFGHVLLWQDAHWKSVLDLMTELSGVEEAVLRELRYPDADRVMEAFMAMLTETMRDDIVNGRIGMKAPPVIDPADYPNEGSPPAEPDNPTGPGVPLPPEEEAGFDLSDEEP